MTSILAVHGIGQQMETPQSLHRKWWPAMVAGVRAAGGNLTADATLICPCYGSLFRPIGFLAATDPPFVASDIRTWEADLLRAWWQAAAGVDRNVVAPGASTLVSWPSSIQRGLNALLNARFFASVAENALIFDLRQVNVYINDENNGKFAIREEVAKAVREDVRVIVAHSFGSVVAYELLSAHPEWPVKTLITLGSPLGMPNLIFDRLEPPPANGRGRWPGNVKTWVNIADPGDIVALEKRLASRFGERVEDVAVDNGATAHDATSYLNARETGGAIARAIGLV